jgi:Kef-type K+ transport system membrane component KefB
MRPMAEVGTPPSVRRTVFWYGAMIGGAIAVFELIRWYGQRLVSPPRDPANLVPASGRAGSQAFLHVLLALIVVILAARALGALFKYVQQPPVVGEVIAGIALGPSLLGRVWPAAASFVLPASIAPFLSVIAQVGVVLFMFLVGLELDMSRLRRRSHTTIAISHASIVLPFLLGALLALWLYPVLSSADVPFTVFALFLGISLSVTAFPVLARILTDRGIQKTTLGVMALTCAAVDDATAWCLLAVIVGVVNARASGAVRTIGLSGAYVVLMLAVVRPLAARFVRRHELRKELQQGAIATVLIGLLLSAFATEAIGIHAIFGAFLLGAIIPHDSLLARELTRRLEDVVVVLLLPAFFAFTGMRTQIGLLSGAAHWAICGVIIAVASAGKFGGTFIAGRLTGLATRDAASLGILMNTRGLMELIVLNLGLDLHVISPTLFAMLVLMAVVTTLATTPILQLLHRPGQDERLLNRSAS